MISMVLDSSAVIAVISKETGYEEVEKYLLQGVVSTVNVTEIISYMVDKGLVVGKAATTMQDLDINIVPYTEKQALIAGELRAKTRHKGLSLADRACLALAIDKNLPVLTADRVWAELNLGIKIRLIR